MKTTLSIIAISMILSTSAFAAVPKAGVKVSGIQHMDPNMPNTKKDICKSAATDRTKTAYVEDTKSSYKSTKVSR